MAIRWKGVITVVCSFLVQFTLGTVYTFGNMNPYITSYMKFNSSSPEITYSESTWIFSMSLFGIGSSIVLGGLMENKIGSRVTSLIGGWFMSLGVLLTWITVKTNFILISLTYGLMVGIGTGISYGVTIAAAMRWYPNKKGMVSGIVAAGFGGGSLVFNELQTVYINPRNEKANITIGADTYFDQPDILENVPSCFLLLGAAYAAMQLLGSCLLFPAPAPDEGKTMLIQEDTGQESEQKVDHLPAQEQAVEPPVPIVQAIPQLEDQISPKQLIRMPQFWILWLTFFANTQTLVYVTTQYKAYGLYCKFDDQFLAVAGSVSAVFNSVTRVAWGLAHDHFGYWPPMLVLCTSIAVLMGTFYLNTSGPFYFVYVCLMFAMICGNFSLFPAACVKLFGQKHFSVNYGLVFTGNSISAIIGAVLTTQIREHGGWLGLFLSSTAFSAAGSLLTILFFVITYARRSGGASSCLELNSV